MVHSSTINLQQKGFTMVKKQNTETNTQLNLDIDKQYDDEKRIVVFVNEKRKKEKPNSPLMRGQFTLNGVKYYLSLWDGEKDGKPYWYGQIRDSREPINSNGVIFPTSK
jgi:hypothetical protein